MSLYVKLTAFLLCGIASLATSVVSADEEPSAEDVQAQVKQLIGDLDADRLSVRREAEQRLLKLGPAALPHLPPPELIPQPGVRQILRRLRIQLENQQARLSAKASHVTLKGDFPLEEILRAINEQTGNKFDTSQLPAPLLERPTHVDFQGTPFWRVVDQLADTSRLNFNIDESRAALQLRPANDDPTEAAVGYSGAFRIAVTSIRRREEHRDVRFSLVILAEPRLRPLFFSYAARDWTAKTSDGRELPVRNPDAYLNMPLAEGGRTALMTIDFIGADDPVDAISVSGEVSMTTAAGEEEIRFTDLGQSQGVSRRRGGVTVILDKVAAQEYATAKYSARFKVAVAYDAGGPAFESHRTWIYHNRVYLETDDGERIDFPGGQQNSLSRTGAVVIEYPFPKLDLPLSRYAFVYVAPTLIVNIPVKVHFDSLRVEN